MHRYILCLLISCLLMVAGDAFAQFVVTGTSLNIGASHVLRSSGPTYNTVAGGANNTNYSNFAASIGGGTRNLMATNTDGSVISGGTENHVQTTWSVIAGGLANKILITNGLPVGHNETLYGVIGGGLLNTLHGVDCVISGGEQNYIGPWANFSVISGGWSNTITYGSGYSVISGGTENVIEDGAWWGAINGGRWNEIEGSGEGTNASTYFAHYGWIGGGALNYIDRFGTFGSIGGGLQNSVEGHVAVIGGGEANTNAAARSAIPGGIRNVIKTNAQNSFIGGGWANVIGTNAEHSVIGGGSVNTIANNATNPVIAGGYANEIATGSSFCTVPGGGFNRAGGNASLAAGWRAKADHEGAFVWADYSASDFSSTNANQFRVRASGGVQLFSNSSGTAGVNLTPGSGTWASLCDRNAKTNFQPSKPREVLEKLASIPISTWNYKSQSDDIRHIGPMAQDFRAAFGVGDDEWHITTVDADGVALAAIQGLYEMLREKETQLRELQKELNTVKEQVAK